MSELVECRAIKKFFPKDENVVWYLKKKVGPHSQNFKVSMFQSSVFPISGGFPVECYHSILQ